MSVKDASVVAGEGSIDYPKILKAGQKNDLEYYITEQESYEGTTPLEAAKGNADYMKKLKI